MQKLLRPTGPRGACGGGRGRGARRVTRERPPGGRPARGTPPRLHNPVTPRRGLGDQGLPGLQPLRGAGRTQDAPSVLGGGPERTFPRGESPRQPRGRPFPRFRHHLQEKEVFPCSWRRRKGRWRGTDSGGWGSTRPRAGLPARQLLSGPLAARGAGRGLAGCSLGVLPSQGHTVSGGSAPQCPRLLVSTARRYAHPAVHVVHRLCPQQEVTRSGSPDPDRTQAETRLRAHRSR